MNYKMLHNKISLIEIISILNSELSWCNTHPMVEKVSPEYREGFMKGIEQAKYLITKAVEEMEI